MNQIVTASDNITDDVMPENGKHFTLQEMQKIVEGKIEFVYLKDGRIMVIDEEGKFKNKPKNDIGTLLLHFAGGAHDDFIVGDVLLCERQYMD